MTAPKLKYYTRSNQSVFYLIRNFKVLLPLSKYLFCNLRLLLIALVVLFFDLEHKQDHSPRVNLHLSILWLLMSTCGIGIHFATCQAPICRRTDSVKGYRLSGNVFLSQTRDHILSCFEACKANEMCQSINFDLETNLCELNNRTRNGRSRMFLPTERSVYLDNPFRGG